MRILDKIKAFSDASGENKIQVTLLIGFLGLPIVGMLALFLLILI